MALIRRGELLKNLNLIEEAMETAVHIVDNLEGEEDIWQKLSEAAELISDAKNLLIADMEEGNE